MVDHGEVVAIFQRVFVLHEVQDAEYPLWIGRNTEVHNENRPIFMQLDLPYRVTVRLPLCCLIAAAAGDPNHHTIRRGSKSVCSSQLFSQRFNVDLMCPGEQARKKNTLNVFKKTSLRGSPTSDSLRWQAGKPI